MKASEMFVIDALILLGFALVARFFYPSALGISITWRIRYVRIRVGIRNNRLRLQHRVSSTEAGSIRRAVRGIGGCNVVCSQ